VRVLVLHAHPARESLSRAACDAAERGLRRAGHDVRVVHLDDEGFSAAMTLEERRAYETPAPILDPVVARHAEWVRWAEALVFVYPTWWGTMPAPLKGWLDRVLVPGVAFHLDPETNKVRPDLGHIRVLAGVSTYGSPWPIVFLSGDAGRRTILRALRLLCGLRCRRVWVGLYGVDTSADDDRRRFLERVEDRMARL
jgi:putative NADPH-quinone reductase